MKINNYVWEKDLSLNDLVLKQKEEIVDWFAIQYPKLKSIYEKLNIEE